MLLFITLLNLALFMSTEPPMFYAVNMTNLLIWYSASGSQEELIM